MPTSISISAGSLLLSVAILASATPLSPHPRHNVDPCAALNGPALTPFKPSEVRACFETIPFNSSSRDHIMTIARTMTSIGLFEYNQLHDESSAESQDVNIGEELDRIGNTTYSTDWAFQRDLGMTMDRLNDAHYGYYGCYWFKVFGTVHPFALVGLQEKNETGIYLPEDLSSIAKSMDLEAHYTELGFNLTKLAGAKVLSIEALDPMRYLKEVWVPKAGKYQDPQQRLNAAFSKTTGEHGWMARKWGQFTVPEGTQDFSVDEIHMDVKTVDNNHLNLTIPLVARSALTVNVTSGLDYYNQRCVRQPPKPVSQETSELTPEGTEAVKRAKEINAWFNAFGQGTNTTEQLVGLAYKYCPRLERVNASALAGYVLPSSLQPETEYLGGREIGFYRLNGSDVGVMSLNTFLSNEPNGDPTACHVRFMLDAYLGIQNFTTAGVKKIIIDTSNNGGGSVLFNQWLQFLLTGTRRKLDLNFPTVIRRSPITEKMMNAYGKGGKSGLGLFNPASFRAQGDATAFGVSDDLFAAGQTFRINGRELRTSDQAYDLLDDLNPFIRQFDLDSWAGWPSENLVFTGNGLCGSSCSSFTNFLIEYHNATAMIQTPDPETDIEFQAYAAGQVNDYQEVLSAFANLNLTDPSMPDNYLWGYMRSPTRAALSPVLAPDVFIQYRPYPAQFRYTPTMAQYMKPTEDWEYVAKQIWG